MVDSIKLGVLHNEGILRCMLQLFNSEYSSSSLEEMDKYRKEEQMYRDKSLMLEIETGDIILDHKRKFLTTFLNSCDNNSSMIVTPFNESGKHRALFVAIDYGVEDKKKTKAGIDHNCKIYLFDSLGKNVLDHSTPVMLGPKEYQRLSILRLLKLAMIFN